MLTSKQKEAETIKRRIARQLSIDAEIALRAKKSRILGYNEIDRNSKRNLRNKH